MNTTNQNYDHGGTPIEDIIYGIQIKLLFLSRINDKIKRVNADGIYGDETYESVASFQEYYGLPKTGSVDYDTFTLLTEVYLDVSERNKKPAAAVHFTRDLSNGSASSGQEFDLVKSIQMMLNTNGIMYDIERLEENGIYDQPTRNAVAKFQYINGLPPTGETDRDTWNVLCQVYSKYVNAE